MWILLMAQIIVTLAVGTDDAHETDASTGFSRTANFLNVSSSTATTSRFNAGMRFEDFDDLGALGGVTIDSAFLRVRAQNTANDDFNLEITCERIPFDADPGDPKDFSDDPTVSGRLSSQTTARVDWVEDGVGIDDRVPSPDIKDVIQEIVDIAEFSGTIVVLCEGKSDTAKNGHFLSFEGTGAKRPQLEVNYTPNVTEILIETGTPDVTGQLVTGSGGSIAILATGTPDVTGQVVTTNTSIGLPALIATGTPDVTGFPVAAPAPVLAVLDAGMPDVTGLPVTVFLGEIVTSLGLVPRPIFVPREHEDTKEHLRYIVDAIRQITNFLPITNTLSPSQVTITDTVFAEVGSWNIGSEITERFLDLEVYLKLQAAIGAANPLDIRLLLDGVALDGDWRLVPDLSVEEWFGSFSAPIQRVGRGQHALKLQAKTESGGSWTFLSTTRIKYTLR